MNFLKNIFGKKEVDTSKPKIIRQLERELKTIFIQVDIIKIVEYKNLGKRYAEYSIDQNQHITGLCIAGFELKQIPNILQRFLQNTHTIEHLTYLNLTGNRLTNISVIKELKNLMEIDFSFNPIKELPYEVFINLNNIENWSDVFYLNHEIKSPPIEIIDQGKEAIRNYLAQLKAGEDDYLFEAKLILVGEERAGKSTLAKALSQTDFKINLHEQSIEGIDILCWDIPKTNTETNLTVSEELACVCAECQYLAITFQPNN